MNKFIELTVDGEKHLFHTDTIFEIEPERSGCRLYQTVYAPGSADFTNVVVDESYEQVKALIAPNTNAGDKDNKILYKVTADMVGQARELCGLSRCDVCPYHGHRDGCLDTLIADCINKELMEK